MRLIDELKARELFFATTDESFGDFLENNKVTFYLGADPTGDSLHVGHLVTYLVAKRLQNHGHHPVLLIGGATGLIGDPKMQGERKMLDTSITLKNSCCLEKQVREIFVFEKVVNNYEWIHKIDVISFLRDYGKEFNVNYMINKDTVKSRLETGISYTEFSYQILQALDWNYLYQHENCTVQIGGQDQWGNMTSGIELIRKKNGPEAKVFALTIPLILKSDGTKFGKSEGGKSVWLDKKKTSPYEFYQFWVNTPDNEVIKRLKQFTFISLEEIAEIEKSFISEPHLRLAQKTLAKEITIFVHGEEAYKQALKITDALFNGNIKELTSEEIEMGFNELPSSEGVDNELLIDALVRTSLASSKREAREFIKGGAVTVNGDKVTNLEFALNKDLTIDNKFIVLRRGKKKYGIVRF